MLEQEVAPRAGAWIETVKSNPSSERIFSSRPVRARGLKQQAHDVTGLQYLVAPRAGAWIETYQRLPNRANPCRRAPCGRVD